MDARNAAESSSTKQPASPKEGDTGRDALKSKPTSSTTTDTIRSPTNNKPPSLVPDSLSAISSSHTLDENAASDQNSDAETIVLPGKDGVSPSKPRKVIKHEDKSDEEMNGIPRPKKPWTDARNADRNGAHSDNLTVKKKRPTERERKTDPLGSVPTSPPNNKHRNNGSHRRRKSGDIQSESGSESSRSRSQEPSRKDKAKLIERRPPFKRKSVKVESDDDGEMRKGRRPRISDTSIDTPAGGRERDQRPTSGRQAEKPSTTRNRSTSPPSRIHRRSLSTQHPSHSSDGIGSKKRRVPAPLQSTDYQSDDSSASGSPHPRGSKLRSVATPITGESTISPARIPGHRKHVDNHGQTLLAKACAKGEYEIAKKRLSERPEDLNFADYAGNTPLQIASLHGHEDIVQLLIEAGCNLDCRNGDKETPLLDAVENGHLEVVKLLLKAGVNPRKADAAGHEPLEKVPDDLDNAEEIRAALREAKERAGELRRTSEDHQPHDLPDTYSSHGPDSPRESPAAHTGSNLAEKRRGGTVRSTKTSNHLLYMNLDDKTLRQAAARGDHETVTRVLQVKERCDDPEALVNAARGGHALVVELLLALGSATPDPRPVASLPPEYNTPILAAIGQENLDVIKLLVNANGFNPTRLSKGLTYYEIARRREGPNWKDEEHILKTAFDDFKKGTKGSSRPKSSPSRREREQESESKRATRNDLGSDASRGQKRRPSVSPSREIESKKRLNSTKGVKSPRAKRRSSSFGTHDLQTSPKRGPGRLKKDDRGSNVALSDREVSPTRSKNLGMPAKLVESEVAGSSDGEAIKPRRKLISGKDLKGQREKQRRESMASSVTGVDRSESKADEPTKARDDREKQLKRTKTLKRDESTDRLSVDASGKRHRLSSSPSRRGTGEREESRGPVKRRKLDTNGRDMPPEGRQIARELSRDPIKRQRIPDTDRKESSKPPKTNRDRRESAKSCHSDKSITVASEEPDTEMPDADGVSEEEGEIPPETGTDLSKEQRKTMSSDSAQTESRRKEAERERQEKEKKSLEEEKRRKEEAAEKKRLEIEERNRVEREELRRKEAAEKARQEEERRQKEEADRKQKEEQERLRREEEEKKRREEEERKLQEERERKLREEEEERKRREEEERIRLEKEAEEEARRIREEEERLHRERERERERERAEQAAREAALRAEQERIRVSKLPPLLRWLDGCPDPKHAEIATLFAHAQGVRFDTIDPSATGKPGGRDQWLLNTQVALLLGEKDLSLSRYNGWERIPVSRIAKRVIWRLEQDRYALTASSLYHLGEQLPDFYGGSPRQIGYKKLEEIRGEAANRFFDMDMFFVKESDFLALVPTIPHLRNVRVAICYRELPEDESNFNTFAGTKKWKTDPDAASRGFFAPRSKYYVNGELLGEEKPGRSRVSRDPFPEQRVPRRQGLTAVTPDDPDYARVCVEQNLSHLLTEQQKQSVLNGSHLTPKSMASIEASEYTGEDLSPTQIPSQTHLVNGIRNGNGESPSQLPNGSPSADSANIL